MREISFYVLHVPAFCYVFYAAHGPFYNHNPRWNQPETFFSIFAGPAGEGSPGLSAPHH